MPARRTARRAKPGDAAGVGKDHSPEALAGDLRQRLDATGTIDPAALADLFVASLHPSDHGRAVFRTLKMFLARRTIAHARARVPYYRDRAAYGEPIGEEAGAAVSLGAIPSINRAIVAAAHADFLADDVHFRSVCHTSGVTGAPLEVYKSHEEIGFIGAFFSRMIALPLAAPRRTLSLSFPTPHHGVPVPMPSPSIVFVGGVTDDALIKDAHRVLAADYRIDGEVRRISTLSGLGFQILFFTNYLLEQKADPAAFGLEGISVAGGFLPRHWRNFLEQAWGCPVHDRYSLTEAVGGATRCPACDLFRSDLQVIFEVVDVDTGRPLTSGIGKLLATNLYPFAQMMPLIRYETGDLVRLGECKCIQGPAFEFLGRLGNCLSAGSGPDRRWLIFSAKLHELLAELPDFNVYEWYSNVRAVKDRSIGSQPIVGLTHQAGENGRIRIRLEAELRYSPYAHPERAAELKRRLTEGLAACEGTAFAEGLAQGRVDFDIELLPPGGFTGEYVIKI